MRILGIDPGFERLGIAVLEKNKGEIREKIIFSECFKTSPKIEFSERLVKVGKEIQKVIKKYKPEILAIETLFFTANQKTAMKVSEARGVVVYECANANMKVFEASPLEIKMSVTGHGKADKKQVIKMVKMILGMKEGKDSDDELDAIAVALTASARFSTFKK